MRVDVGRRDGYSRPEVPLSFRRGTHQCAQIVVCTGIARPQSARCKKIRLNTLSYFTVEGEKLVKMWFTTRQQEDGKALEQNI